ncbi:hypothetical protein BHM03_00003317 [Ensete ventricosum]|nr:hypothetical protein BHM03_00003317 [Ensete ventricosum]
MSCVYQPDKSYGTIKEQLAAIAPLLEQMCKQKEDRVREFADVQLQIEEIRGEIAGNLKIGEQIGTTVDEEDLSLKKLDEYQFQLQELQKEKVPHYSLQELAAQLTDLWNLMDTPMEEQSLFSHVTCNISATVDEVTIPGALALDLIEQDQKRIHEQLATEKEALFGSRPSPARPLGPKKVMGPHANGGASNGTPSRRLSLNANQGSMNGVRSLSRDGKRDSNRPAAPVNYVAIAKEDAASQVCVTEQAPASP